MSIELRTTPHLHAPDNVIIIMRNVVFALLPICAWSVWQFGISALALILTTLASCLITERLFNPRNTLGDWSAAITGLLLALTLPPAFPLWMAAVAGFVAMALGKLLFGGLGMNVFNPALVGRAFVQAAFPVAITTWTPALFEGRFREFIPTSFTLPFTIPPAVAEWNSRVAIDGFTGATPLGLHKFEGVSTPVLDLFLGNAAGSAGETSALIILLGGLYLAARKFLDWRIPLFVLLGAGLTAALFHALDPQQYPSAPFMLFSGGLMLGAWFMATDMVGSPVTPWGVVVYGLLIGVLTIIIRLFGGLSEGVMYAILLGNAATPLIEQFTQPRVFGEKRS
ncbi:RnfABCDGE type electron transport complex subunit D [Thiolapillus brandeum]|uniref:Ion-translocating oxidoreductase complex subunit D n=1 Tax=Thiolapillus brandeum TaxID=1076588 RepID=A0A7U6JI34_9GAMM|nr:RnfABCDGE type electron transport complex subunit D [Thiolapillus brandeum]BAO43825.1 electron transport complex protein RnfD [Thiolapillus brandeum]